MMELKRTGGPAFARPASVDPRQGTGLVDGDDYLPEQDGMSLRDWFAGRALTGYLAMYGYDGIARPSPEQAAQCAYEYADAMLSQRLSR